MKKRPSFPVLVACGSLLAVLVFPAPAAFAQDQVQKAKIFQDEYQMLVESDLYCSIFVFEGERPPLRIIGSERQKEKELLSDADIFYVDKGRADGLEIGQMFLTVSLAQKIGGFGPLAKRKGRARVIRLEEHQAVVRIDKACGAVEVGDYVIPYEDREGVLGRDLGYGDLDPAAGKHGKVIYLETDFNIVGAGHYAIVDLGLDQGIRLGQQLTVFKRAAPNLPREAVGNLVVIDLQKQTATVKLLSSRDAVEMGDEVQTKG
ncbi:MAG: hypothetical protein OEW05_04140 [Candidatus Aminicenantes bacterium]|nr:hypothetical protein [Candidatus Aminicenantes bacterium]